MLSYFNLPADVKRLASASLGRGVLKSVFKGGCEYHLVLKINNGELIGFAIYHFEERVISGKASLVGVIDAVIIAVAYRRSGHGGNLTHSVLRKMAGYGVDRIEVLIKEPGYSDRDYELGVPLASPDVMFLPLGFKRVKVMRDFYKADSVRHRYDCKFCGNSPDTCQSVLYARDADF